MASSNNMLSFMVRQTWRYAGSMRRRLAAFYALFLFANILIAFQPMALAKIINTVQGNGTGAVHDALAWGAVYGGITVMFWLLHGPARVIERRTAFAVFDNFVSALYRKVTEMPLRWHQDHHSGDTINRVNKAGRALFNFAQEQFIVIQMAVRFSMSFILLKSLFGMGGRRVAGGERGHDFPHSPVRQGAGATDRDEQRTRASS